jgi:hypothetical protein
MTSALDVGSDIFAPALTGTSRLPLAPLVYHGGHVATNAPVLYYIWYGDWSQDQAAVDLLENLGQTIGGSSYYALNTTFANSCGKSVPNAVIFWGHVFDPGSMSNDIGDNTPAIVENAILSNGLPLDPDGIYVVLGASDVTEALFCHPGCGYHYYMSVSGVRIRYAFIGNARTRCPSSCIPPLVPSFPNEPWADGMATTLAHELSEAATDGWNDAWREDEDDKLENGDMCTGQFGTTYHAASGATANIHLGNSDYLLQTLWLNGPDGYCANALTTANATCANGVLDGSETDVDCGGSCPACNLGQRCSISKDCGNSWCSAGVCTAANCTNGVKDGIESDVDCGELCAGCAVGKSCGFDSDCQSHLCVNSVCAAHCANGVKDVDETDVDCGGSCGGCALGKACVVSTDCASRQCAHNTVCTDLCSNGLKDLGETDVDCGGICPPCALGKACKAAADCASQVCQFTGSGHACVDHCTDGVLDFGETDVDCGGGGCPKCTLGKYCKNSLGCTTSHCFGSFASSFCGCGSVADCPAGAGCTGGFCAGHCSDGIRDFDEGAVDCGGADCAKCSLGSACNGNNDCASQSCQAKVCVCAAASDCAAGQVCVSGTCYDPCADHIKDGSETDIDCGGGTCGKCQLGASCHFSIDCQSRSCHGGKCGCSATTDCPSGQTCSNSTCISHCQNHVQDFDETGLDCGGASCPLCPICYGP